MIVTRTTRAKELDNISETKRKLKPITEVPVRVDHRTVIMVREGKDKDKAVEEFRRKQMEFAKREFKNDLQF